MPPGIPPGIPPGMPLADRDLASLAAWASRRASSWACLISAARFLSFSCSRSFSSTRTFSSSLCFSVTCLRSATVPSSKSMAWEALKSLRANSHFWSAFRALPRIRRALAESGFCFNASLQSLSAANGRFSLSKAMALLAYSSGEGGATKTASVYLAKAPSQSPDDLRSDASILY